MKESLIENISSKERLRISLIEDNLTIRRNLSKYLSYHQEFEVIEFFGSVESFLHRLKKSPPFNIDVLLLDIGLPGISGIEGIPKILDCIPELDIVMLTNYEEEDVILKAICAGACSYISKKADLQDVVNAIRIVSKGGSYMSPSVAREIVDYIMGGQVSKATILTNRQKEILEKLVDGKSYRQIGQELFISVETVRTHIKKMYKTLQVNNKAEAISKYLKGEIH